MKHNSELFDELQDQFTGSPATVNNDNAFNNANNNIQQIDEDGELLQQQVQVQAKVDGLYNNDSQRVFIRGRGRNGLDTPLKDALAIRLQV